MFSVFRGLETIVRSPDCDRMRRHKKVAFHGMHRSVLNVKPSACGVFTVI